MTPVPASPGSKLKLNERLVTYRTRLQGVEVYMKRNGVSREVQLAVRRHFRRSFDEAPPLRVESADA